MIRLTNALVDGVSVPIDVFRRDRREKREEIETAKEVARVKAAIKAGRLQMVPLGEKRTIAPIKIVAPVKTVATAMASRTAALVTRSAKAGKATTKASKQPPALARRGSSYDAPAPYSTSASNEDTDLTEAVDNDFGFGHMSVERHPSLTLPRVCIRLIKKSVTNESIDKLLQCMDALLMRDQPFTLLVDVRHCCLPSRAQIRRAKDWSKAHETQLNRSLQGIVVLLSSSMVRATVNMVLSMQKPRQPTLVATREEDCFAFARDQCTEVRVWTKDGHKRKRAGSGDSTATDDTCSDSSSRSSSPTTASAAARDEWQDINVGPTLPGGTRGTLVPASTLPAAATTHNTPKSVRVHNLMPKSQSRAEAFERDISITFGSKTPLSAAAVAMRRQRAREIAASRGASAPVTVALEAATMGCGNVFSRLCQRVNNAFTTQEADTMESAAADALGFSSTKAVGAPTAMSMIGRFY